MYTDSIEAKYNLQTSKIAITVLLSIAIRPLTNVDLSQIGVLASETTAPSTATAVVSTKTATPATTAVPTKAAAAAAATESDIIITTVSSSSTATGRTPLEVVPMETKASPSSLSV